MSKAELCPVCNGQGKINPMNETVTTTVGHPVTCHGCDGKGWIEVGGMIDFPIAPSPTCPCYPTVTYWGVQPGNVTYFKPAEWRLL
jgi:hypothetical protein